MTKKEVLLIIDPQLDFTWSKEFSGALPVPGPRDDRGFVALQNVAKFINRYGSRLDDIIVTLDCHHPVHVAHPIWFQDEKGNHPSPFTAVKESAGEILAGTLGANGFTATGKLRCTRISQTKRTLEYLRALDVGKRYPHMLWNPHCIIGTPGGCMIPEVAAAIRNWEESQFAIAAMISKGSGWPEHFGALRAEVPDPADDSTQVNSYFLSLLSDPDTTVYGCGLALSHCLANTARDTAAEFDADSFCQRFVLLRDGTESVAGLEFLGDAFINDFMARGMRVCKTTDL